MELRKWSIGVIYWSDLENCRHTPNNYISKNDLSAYSKSSLVEKSIKFTTKKRRFHSKFDGMYYYR